MIKVELKKDGEAAIAFIQGDIDHHTAKEIREQIDEYIQGNRAKLLKLDFSQINFMDSSGIGLIMGRYKIMKMLNGNVKVINLPTHLKRLIKISGLLGLGVIEEGEI